MKSTMTIP
jgi:hypothetical protein